MTSNSISIDNRPGIWRKYRNQVFLGIVLVLGIYVLLLVFLDSQGELSNTDGVIEALVSFPFGLLIPIIVSQMFLIMFRFIEWHYYIRIIGAKGKISLLDSAIIQLSGFIMVVSPGKAAEALKTVFLKAKTGIPIARSVPVVIAERIVDGLAVIIILVITLIVSGDSLNLGDYDGWSRVIIYSSAAMLGTGLIVVQIAPLAYFCLNLIKRMPLVNRLHESLVEFYESSREIFHLRHVIPMLFVGLGVYTSGAIGFFIILGGMGFEPNGQLFLQATFILGVTSAVAALSFVPNGAGISEASTTVMLVAIVGATQPQMTLPVATAAAIIQGFFYKWFRVLVGLAVAILFRKRLFDANLERALFEYERESIAREKKPQQAPASELSC